MNSGFSLKLFIIFFIAIILANNYYAYALNNQVYVSKQMSLRHFDQAIASCAWDIIKLTLNLYGVTRQASEQALFNKLKTVSLALIEDENYQASISTLNLAYLLNKQDKAVVFLLARSYIRVNQPGCAENILKQMGDINDKRIIESMLLYYKSDFPQALAVLVDLGNDLNKENAQIYYELKSEICLKLGLLSDAQAALVMAAKNCPDNYAKITTLVKSHFLAKITPNDIANLLIIGKLYPCDTIWHSLLAKCYRVSNNDKCALRQYKVAFNCRRMYVSLYKDYALYCLSQKKYQEALVAVNNLLDYYPYSYKFKIIKADIYLGLKHDNQAVLCLGEAIKANPCYAETYLKLANFYKAQHNFNRAIKCLTRLNANCPNYAQGYFDLAQLYELNNNMQLSNKNYQLFITLNNDYIKHLNIFVKHEIAIAYASLGITYYICKQKNKLIESAYNFNQFKYVPQENFLFSQIRPPKIKVSYDQVLHNEELQKILIADMLVEKSYYNQAESEYKAAEKISPNNQNLANYLNYIYSLKQDYLNSMIQSYKTTKRMSDNVIDAIAKQGFGFFKTKVSGIHS